MADPTLTPTVDGETTTFGAAGHWIAAHSSALEQLVDTVSLQQPAHRIAIDIAGVEAE